MLKYINKHTKGLAGNMNQYIVLVWRKKHFNRLDQLKIKKNPTE